jgi:predicted lipoprotein with Yx(FWY)xxD motif
MSRTRIAVAVSAVSLGLLLGACGQAATTSGSPTRSENDVALANAGRQATTKIATSEIDGLGEVLVDGEGFTLYRFDKDTNSPPTSNCDDDCAAAWPPVLAEGDVTVEGFDDSVVGTVTRSDGDEQVTVNGWPIYRYSQDTAPGDANGQGIGGTWFGVTSTGGKAGQESESGDETEPGDTDPTTPPSDESEPGDEGSSGLDLAATEIPNFGPALTDGEGRTLYLFTNDSKDPSTTTCVEDCATKWPPLTVDDGSVDVQGVDESLVGTITRPDGGTQVTVGGWPVYRYAQDTAAGQTNGHGVGGTWFVIEPAGCKSSVPVGEDGGY